MLAGLTIAKGEAYNRYGGNVNISTVGGTVSNCVIASPDAARDNGQASGLSADAGLVTHCVFRNNYRLRQRELTQRACPVRFMDLPRIENRLIEKSLYSAEAHLTKVSGRRPCATARS